MCRRRSLRVLGLVAAFVFSTGAIIAGPGYKNDNQGQTKDQTDLRKKYLRPTDPALYVGAETCQACHEDIYKNFETTQHFVTMNEHVLFGLSSVHRGTWNYERSSHLLDGVGCIDCHSPHHAKKSEFLLRAKSPRVLGRERSSPKFAKESNMEKRIKNVEAMTLAGPCSLTFVC